MGRRKGWFSAVKKALGSEHKEHGNQQRSKKSKKKWFAKHKEPDPISASAEDERVANEPDMDVAWSILEEPYAPPDLQELKPSGVRCEDKENHACSVAFETDSEAVVSTQAAAEAVGLKNLSRFAGKSKEEVAAIKIQTAFRGRIAKRALRALRGLVRLKSLMHGSSSIKRQATSTLQCMQTLSRVQSQIRERRIRLSEENLALQRQLHEKHEKEMEKMKLSIGDDWNDSTKSKEKLEESLRYRQEAAVRRERALAYAHSHQQKWRNVSKNSNPTFMDPINPHWGWSWLERWMAARPWESSIALDNGGRTSAIRPLSVEEISKAYFVHRDRHPDNSNKPLPIPQRSSRISTRRSLSTSASKAPSAPSMSTKLKSSSNKEGITNGRGEDSKSIAPVKQRRHSSASTHSARSDTVPTVARKAKSSRLQNSSSSSEKTGISSTTSKAVKKQQSYSPSRTPSVGRRHSGPPTVDSSSIKN
ncbi:unnamed protein product [Rhodiola kirilowii]